MLLYASVMYVSVQQVVLFCCSKERNMYLRSKVMSFIAQYYVKRCCTIECCELMYNRAQAVFA